MKLKDLKNLSVREKILISALIMVAIAVAGFMLGVKPLQAKLAEVENTLQLVDSEKQSKDNVINGKEYREENVGTLIGKIEAIERTYATKTTHENMDIVLTSLAQKHNLTTNTFSVSLLTELGNGEEEKGKKKSSLTTNEKVDSDGNVVVTETPKIPIYENGLVLECYTYGIVGNYKKMLRYIEDLNSDSKVQISSFTLSYEKGEGVSDLLNININIKELGPDYIYARETIPDAYSYLASRIDKKPIVEDNDAEKIEEGSQTPTPITPPMVEEETEVDAEVETSTETEVETAESSNE